MQAVGLAVFASWLLASPAAAGAAPQNVAPAAKALLGLFALTLLAIAMAARALRRRRRLPAFITTHRSAGSTRIPGSAAAPSHEQRVLTAADL
jgi:hypothetical protein